MIKKIIAFALLFSFIYQISYIFLPFNVPFVMGLVCCSDYKEQDIYVL